MKTATKKLGGKIKELREQSRLTQINIAGYLKVDQSLISKFESGERAISSDMLEKLVDLFGVSLSELVDNQPTLKHLKLALRASDVTTDDLVTISVINRIALYSNMISQMNED
ncbi:MAG: helix-turn-helix transcriptional regulator [Clostridiales bacterium]|nr:helix-turn-helix transcriptional regulator [Clostridiales bacterium]